MQCELQLCYTYRPRPNYRHVFFFTNEYLLQYVYYPLFHALLKYRHKRITIGSYREIAIAIESEAGDSLTCKERNRVRNVICIVTYTRRTRRP